MFSFDPNSGNVKLSVLGWWAGGFIGFMLGYKFWQYIFILSTGGIVYLGDTRHDNATQVTRQIQIHQNQRIYDGFSYLKGILKFLFIKILWELDIFFAIF